MRSAMSNYKPVLNTLPLDGRPVRPCQNASSASKPSGNRRPSPIYTLNGDILLNVFRIYRLAADPDEYENENGGLRLRWSRHRWWYKLAHACRLWRSVILSSPSRLDLTLVCTNGVSIAEMLAHSPPLPLTIYYQHENSHKEITAEDESGILLALSHRDRVRRIFFSISTPILSKFITAMDDRFPILERMYIFPRHNGSTNSVLPIKFEAPNLRRLCLSMACLPIGSRLLTTTSGLVTLSLTNIPVSAYFPPSYLLSRVSIMLQLERLVVRFDSPIPSRAVETQLAHTAHTQSITNTQVTLPNLRWFGFQGTNAYLEGLVSRIIAPTLSILRVYLYNQLSFTFLRLSQFMQLSENFRFSAVKVAFNEDCVRFDTDTQRASELPPLQLQITCRHFDWQVTTAVQIFHTLLPVLSIVEQVTLSHKEHRRSPEWHNEIDRTRWHELFRPFSNAKTLHLQGSLLGTISRSLQSDDGEPAPEVLPNLKEVEYTGGSDVRHAFTAFLNERRAAGRPVSLSLVDMPSAM